MTNLHFKGLDLLLLNEGELLFVTDYLKNKSEKEVLLRIKCAVFLKNSGSTNLDLLMEITASIDYLKNITIPEQFNEFNEVKSKSNDDVVFSPFDDVLTYIESEEAPDDLFFNQKENLPEEPKVLKDDSKKESSYKESIKKAQKNGIASLRSHLKNR